MDTLDIKLIWGVFILIYSFRYLTPFKAWVNFWVWCWFLSP